MIIQNRQILIQFDKGITDAITIIINERPSLS